MAAKQTSIPKRVRLVQSENYNPKRLEAAYDYIFDQIYAELVAEELAKQTTNQPIDNMSDNEV
jgi:hypothetical protein